MSMRDGNALDRMIEREIRKLEHQEQITELLERKIAQSGRTLPEIENPCTDPLDGSLRAETDHPSEWIRVRQRFLEFLRERLAGASDNERAYFWLGASSSFVRGHGLAPDDLKEVDTRLRETLRYHEELDEASGEADQGSERRREEPWDGSLGLARPRQMLASWILREALDLFEEQERAFRLIDE